MDHELETMMDTASAMAAFDDAAKLRMLLWLASRFGLDLNTQRDPVLLSRTSDANSQSSAGQPLGDFAELFFRLNPEGHALRALVAGYWLTSQGGDNFTGQAVNSLLKDLGYKLGNVTDALTQNIREKPALIIQVKKSGTSQQARKQYRITEAGRRYIETLLGQTHQ